jgi:hypothetical protein
MVTIRQQVDDGRGDFLWLPTPPLNAQGGSPAGQPYERNAASPGACVSPRWGGECLRKVQDAAAYRVSSQRLPQPTQ